MIQTNELRIGNYVGGLFDIEQVSVIKAITENDFSYERISDEEYFIGNSIKPIPLTEEWLLKFGFEFGIKLQNFVKGKHQFVELGFINGYFSEIGIFYYGLKTEIKSVHQLQNLYFALTGKELEYAR